MYFRKQIFLVMVAIFATISVINAQQKYAVLITGDNNAVNVPVEDQWNEGLGMGTYGYDEFFNDCFLFWEMLYTEKGYTDENIFVLYDDGFDLNFPEQSTRYQSYPNYQIQNITDQSVSKLNVEQLFEGLANGTYGYPQITQDDFLYVWVMSHGGNTQGENDGDSYFYLQNGEVMYDYELADLVNPINANRKVFQFQCPASGGYINNLTGDNVYIFSSTSTNGESYRADNLASGGVAVVENEEIDGIIYNHGEFNFHTYSAINGETPDFSTTYNGQPLAGANANDNQFVSFGEAKDWNATQHTTSENPESLGDIGFYSAADYPTLFIDDFTEDATYQGIIGVDHDYEPYDYNIFLSNNSISIASNAKATFFNDTRLVIDGSGVMTIEDDVELHGYSDASGILSFNEIYVGENVLFHGEPDDDWGGLVVEEDKTLYLKNTTFQDCYLVCNTFGLNIVNCNFIRSSIHSYVQNISVSNSQFPYSWIYLIKPEAGYGSVRIDNCTLTDLTGELDFRTGISLRNYDYYSVSNCYIDGYKSDGLRIINSGYDVKAKNIIENNTILNNAQWYFAGAMAGLSIIDSYATIHNNHIENNDRGIVTTWQSNVSLYGDSPVVTQKVINNTINQIWSTEDSFPYKFKLNKMHGASNPPYHIVYLSTEIGITKDITHNCWGSTFDPNNPQWYFYPLQNFYWEPVWDCGDEEEEGEAGDDQQLFESAQLKVENEDYFGAETDYLTLVENYPESEYARAAIKELYRLEKEVGNDYDGLQTYYETNPTIQANDGLKNTGDKLAVDCEVRDENYIAAIDMLEEFINNPSTDYDDSLFAVNELGYIYYLMENGNGKSSQIISSPSTKFVAQDILDENTNHHLSLLFKDDVRKESLELNIKKLNTGELLQNVPNPFTGSTEIYYKLQNEVLINIRVYSYTGQLVKEINEGTKEKGVHHIIFDANGLIPGMYYYILEIDGKTSDSKKMVIMN